MRHWLAFLLLAVFLPGTMAVEFRPLVLGSDGKTKQFPNGTDSLRVVPSYGLAASVPAASADNTGQIYITTDTKTILRSNGTTWESVTLPSGTAGGDLGGTYPNPTVESAADNIFTLYDNSDPTKLFAWTLGNQTAGTTLTINSGAQSASRQLSVPVLAGDTSIAVIGQAQTFTGAQTFSTPIASTSGGTGVNNAGTITNASNTTITGGGTLALGGFTLTAPATGTANLLGAAQTVTAAKTHTDAEIITRNTDNTAAAATHLRLERGTGAGVDAEIRTIGDLSNGVASVAIRTQGADVLTVNGAAVTSTAPLITPASTTSLPSLRVPHGAAPSSPTNGDLWTTTSGAFVRVNGATVGPLIDAAGGGAIAAFYAKIANSSAIAITGAGAATLNRTHHITGTGGDYTITINSAGAVAGDVVSFTVAFYASADDQYTLDFGSGYFAAGRTRYLNLVHTNSVMFYFDGGNHWRPLVLSLDTPWVDAGAMTVTATTTNPGKGTTGGKDNVWWRRVGTNLQASYRYKQTVAGTAGNGAYIFAFPIGAADANQPTISGEGESATDERAWAYTQIGYGRASDNSTASSEATPMLKTTTSFSVCVMNQSGAGPMGSGFYAFTTAALRFSFMLDCPMANW